MVDVAIYMYVDIAKPVFYGCRSWWNGRLHNQAVICGVYE